MSVKISVVSVKPPEGTNIVVGHAHFIKTVEDIYEAIVSTVPQMRFGLAFCESSGPRLIRTEGNDEELVKLAVDTAAKVGAGHVFVLYIKNGYPINILNALKRVPEVVTLYCATANPVQFIVAETDQGRALIGVVDGGSPTGVEGEEDVAERRRFLRDIGYKLG